MLRMTLWIIAGASILFSAWIVLEYGVTRPKAIFGSLILGVGFTFAAMWKSRESRVLHSTEYKTEVQRIEAVVRKGINVGDARRILASMMRYDGSNKGFSLRFGPVEVLSFTGETVILRLTCRKSQVASKTYFARLRKGGVDEKGGAGAPNERRGGTTGSRGDGVRETDTE